MPRASFEDMAFDAIETLKSADPKNSQALVNASIGVMGIALACLASIADSLHAIADKEKK